MATRNVPTIRNPTARGTARMGGLGGGEAPPSPKGLLVRRASNDPRRARRASLYSVSGQWNGEPPGNPWQQSDWNWHQTSSGVQSMVVQTLGTQTVQPSWS